MTATPTPLRDTIDQMRDIADVAERYSVEELRDVLREQARRLAAVAPAGMVLVPREPTKEMREAGRAAHYESEQAIEDGGKDNWARFGLRENRAAHVYAAMLAAAPTPPATAGKE